MSGLVELVKRSLSDATTEQFTNRVKEQAGDIRGLVADGTLNNEALTIGMEMEVYAVEQVTERGRGMPLAELPDEVFGDHAAKELGVHNAEINTPPHELDARGIESQMASLRGNFEAARERAREQGLDLVLDAMWTVPPPEGTKTYISANEKREDLTVAKNMRTDPRYTAIDNDVLAGAGGAIDLDVPGASEAFPTILFESLATSIQPHLQIPTVEAVPGYYNAGIRTLGPLLALSANSPFLPLDMYEQQAGDGSTGSESPQGGVSDPETLVERTHHELRIAVFEQSVNETENPKVRVPEDIEKTSETIDRVVEDDLYAPFLREWVTDEKRGSFADEHWEFDYKRGTYWRWLRCVVGGAPVGDACDERSVRIEYRPIPTQPTIQDVVGMQLLTVGLLCGLVETDHPIGSLPWADAERSFYSAARSGLDADLTWITADGEHTNDRDVLFDDIFKCARTGLESAGIPSETVDCYLDPIEARLAAGLTPSGWKKARVQEGLDAGRTLPEAIRDMQTEYIELSTQTDSFAEWL